MTINEDFIRQASPEHQAKMSELYQIIKVTLPEATEKISYNMPAFYQFETLVYLAATKNHLGFYPTAAPIQYFKEELKPYKTSKGSIQFPYDQELPKALIKKICLYRLNEACAKHEKKRNRH